MHDEIINRLLFPPVICADTTMLESMWSSMSSSMQLAQECLERNGDEEAAAATANTPMEGLEKFAQTIDNSEFLIASNHTVSTQSCLQF